MNREILFDPVSLLVTAPAELKLKELENYLQNRGYTLGFSQNTVKNLTLQKALEKGLPNEFALRYGGLEDICTSLEVETKYGAIITKNVPRAATGPDFKKIFIGSKNIYGKIKRATLRVVPQPEKRERWKITFKEGPRGLQSRDKFLKKFWASGIRPLFLNTPNTRTLSLALEGNKAVVLAEHECLKKLAQQTQAHSEELK